MRTERKNFSINSIWIAVLIVSAIAAYANTFHAPFLFDDFNTIVKNNPDIQIDEISFKELKEAATSTLGKKRPLATLSLAVNYYFSGTDTTGYHLFNTAIHALTGIFLFLLFYLTLTLPAMKTNNDEAGTPSFIAGQGPAWIAFLAALLWLLHPLQTNAVTYIVQRMSSMAAMFYVLSLLCYAKGRLLMRDKKTKSALPFLGLCILAGLCAIASKEIAATLPFFILLYEWYFLQDLRAIRKTYLLAGIAAAILIFGGIAYLYVGGNPMRHIMAGYRQWDFTLPQRVMTEFRVIAFYLGLILFPHPSRLTLDYDYPLSHSLTQPPTTFICMLMIAVLFLFAVFTARKHRLLSFALLWFLGNLAIESSVIGIEIIYEHRLYLPSMMLFPAVVQMAWYRFKPKWLVNTAIILIAVCLASWTYQRNQVWSSDVRFWQDAALKAPQDARPLQNLAYSFQQRGEHKKAVHYYQKSLEISKKPAAVYNMGLSQSKLGHHLEAITAFQKAIELNYDASFVYMGLAYELAMIGEFQAAVENYKKALEKDPDNQEAKRHFQELIRFLRQCRTPEACVRALCRQDPENPAIWFKLGFLHEGRRNIKEAITNYEKVLSMMPESDRQLYMLTLNHLATCYLMAGKLDKSISLFAKGARLAPNDYRFTYQLAALHAYKGDTQEALKWLEKAVDSGFSDLARLESDTRFRPLRKMPSFQQLKDRIKG